MKYEDKIRKLEKLEKEAEELRKELEEKAKSILMRYYPETNFDYMDISVNFMIHTNKMCIAMASEVGCVVKSQTFPIAWFDFPIDEVENEIKKRQELKKQEMQKKFEEMEATKRQKKYEEYLALKKEFEK